MRGKNGSLRCFSERPLIINGSLFFPLVCGGDLVVVNGDDGVVTTVLLDFFSSVSSIQSLLFD